MPESRFVQLPQLQPIHGLLPFDEADESGSETDDDDDDGDGDQYVTRTLASPDAPPFAVAAIAAASPLVSPSIPAAGHEPMLVATVDAHALDQEKDSQLDDDAVGSTSSDEDDEDDEDEVEMSIDQLDLLLSQTRSPHSNSNNNNNNMDPTLTASHPSSPSPSPSPLPLPSPPPPSTSLSPIDSGILVPIPTWAWHLILNPNADTTPVDPPKPPIAKKSKTRIAKTSTMDLRRVARDAISAHGCMGRFQRQHGPQPAGAAHKRHAAVAVVAGGGKRGAGKSAV
ncbi:hypothetical protein BCR44DRAFT_33392 [Catenaria anguillulae PL171]|uniref:Uncharacterized protein n=1 Tax=Catenaria anguillulae PL171 TaxID=765915 RepID=A0A1Y2H5W4_9FUNG|nr:hypothetical protein BCR44DRAFT_33392 [Catenaria anguillulae PL171]